ncbi:MAG: helix-turn-helix domain-containing protein [Gemmatimonadota bacterium]|nr:helix-turn-helix domain-containing protein [Gemmatimonadota bacterium]
MSPAPRARADSLAAQLRAAMPLFELRRARQLSQEQLAATLGEKQPSISRLEQRTDMYVSTLRRYIEAMGGQLDIVARFPDGEVSITQFGETDADLAQLTEPVAAGGRRHAGSR